MGSAGGVIMCVWLGGSSRTVFDEALLAARALRRSQRPPLYPLHLHANALAREAVEAAGATSWPWDAVLALGLDPRLAQLDTSRLDGASLPYLHKLSSLLASPFNRTLFLDADVKVLYPHFVSEMLTRVLHVADVAAPIDPGREPHLVEGRPPWVSPAVGPPPLCSAVLAFRKSDATDALFLGAARRLAQRAHPRVRQGDQEMIWFEWTAGPLAETLRVLPLPEEYFCPLERRQPPRPDKRGDHWWRTSWRRGAYRCRAVHGHGHFRGGEAV